MPQGVGEFALTVVVIVVLIAVIIFWRSGFGDTVGNWVRSRFQDLTEEDATVNGGGNNGGNTNPTSIFIPVEDYLIR